MISSVSEVDAHRIQSRYLSREDWTRISQATAGLSGAPILVDDSANVTMLQVRAKAQRLALEQGIDLLVVDYLGSPKCSGSLLEVRPQATRPHEPVHSCIAQGSLPGRRLGVRVPRL